MPLKPGEAGGKFFEGIELISCLAPTISGAVDREPIPSAAMGNAYDVELASAISEGNS
jgi:hypothetical protein